MLGAFNSICGLWKKEGIGAMSLLSVILPSFNEELKIRKAAQMASDI